MHLYIYRDDGTLTTCLPRERGGECRAKMVCSADACGIFVDLRWPAARRGALHIVGECPSAFQPSPPGVSGRLSARQSVTFNRGLSYRTPPPAAKRSYGAATRDQGRGRDKERPWSRRPGVTKSSLWFFFPSSPSIQAKCGMRPDGTGAKLHDIINGCICSPHTLHERDSRTDKPRGTLGWQ